MSSSNGPEVEFVCKTEYDPSTPPRNSNNIYVSVHPDDVPGQQAHQGLTQIIGSLSARNHELETENRALKRRLDALDSTSASVTEAERDAEAEIRRLQRENKRMRNAVRGCLKRETAYARSLAMARNHTPTCPEAEGI